MFVQWNGKPIHPSTPSIWFRKFRERNGLPEMNFHGLRHTNDSLHISVGTDIQTVSQLLNAWDTQNRQLRHQYILTS
ncbi:MAG: hypothetical protein GX213_05800 [Clostridiaceae bacterium]|nr:hypothetical protein [Clostridiaceae bacterium]